MVQWRLSFFALQPVFRVVALVHCLRVEFRHHFVFVRDTGAYNLALFTSHQERLGISIFNEYQKFKAFRKLNNLTPFLDVHLRRQKRTPYVEMMSARLSMCVHPAVRVCPSCCPCVSVLLSVCVRPPVRVCPSCCPSVTQYQQINGLSNFYKIL